MALQILVPTSATLRKSVSFTSSRTLTRPIVARLPSGAAQHVRALKIRSLKGVKRSPARPSTVVTLASELKFEANPENTRDYAPVLGILGLVLSQYNKVALTAPLLLKTIAIYQMAVAATALIFRKVELDSLASVVAPAVLAVYTLDFVQIPYTSAAVGLFGYYLCEHLEGPFWLWIGTLAAALYAGYPSQWFVAAVALAAGTRLVRGSEKNVVPVFTLPTLAAAAWAFWKRATPEFTIALMIGQIVAAALKYAESVSDS